MRLSLSRVSGGECVVESLEMTVHGEQSNMHVEIINYICSINLFMQSFAPDRKWTF